MKKNAKRPKSMNNLNTRDFIWISRMREIIPEFIAIYGWGMIHSYEISIISFAKSCESSK